MSVLEFLSSGGMASISGELSDEEKEHANAIVKRFGNTLKTYARTLQVPASEIRINRSSFLFVAKDDFSYHFVFAEKPGGGNNFVYRDLSNYRQLELQSIVHNVRIDVGDVIWAFTCPISMPDDELDSYINRISVEYVQSEIQKDNAKNDGNISEEAMNVPEIASGLERFRKDYPKGQKTAFIIMQFGDTKAHISLVETIKDELAKHNIIALRADDKEYMDDLFYNIKTYMYGCDFGIAIFERITEDNFNPNVSLEVGYMMGMEKQVLLLKDKTLSSLHTDLAGKLYKPFDIFDIESSLRPHIDKWLSDKGFS
ncbi:TPA: hypothetical protein KFM62_005104 [Escherichia coli]|jgi:hypothetical protein|nr:hypothetical protein [Escherichia coli]HBC9557784.1 hypothetical protein [Escherichia coli]